MEIHDSPQSQAAERIPVEVLGATGTVGQRIVHLLRDHPWFRIVALRASERSVGRPYGEVAQWQLPEPMDSAIASMQVQACEPEQASRIAFSGLDSSVAGEIETRFAEAGYAVVSNARNHRMDSDVPLVVPEVNSTHLDLIRRQRYGMGCILTNPNCSTIGLVIALKPLHDTFGIEAMDVTTLQAASGAGYPGVPSMDLIDNVVPYIRDEEEKMQTEPLKILGTYQGENIRNAIIRISAQCNRVPVSDGHMECVKLSLRQKATLQQVREVLEQWRSPIANLELPSAPEHPLRYLDNPSHPQPRLHRNAGDGMTVTVGRLQECNVLDYKFVVLSHNTIRGAAGAAILNAELLVRSGLRSTLNRSAFCTVAGLP